MTGSTTLGSSALAIASGQNISIRGVTGNSGVTIRSGTKEQPDNYGLIDDLALTNMALGDKAAALALTERAIAANPIEKDALIGPRPVEILARVCSQTGEPDRAIATLQKLLSIPGGVRFRIPLPLPPALLRLDPMFDPLRGDPRFEKLCQDSAK